MLESKYDMYVSGQNYNMFSSGSQITRYQLIIRYLINNKFRYIKKLSEPNHIKLFRNEIIPEENLAVKLIY